MNECHGSNYSQYNSELYVAPSSEVEWRELGGGYAAVGGHRPAAASR